jgi:hypothetical protein
LLAEPFGSMGTESAGCRVALTPEGTVCPDRGEVAMRTQPAERGRNPCGSGSKEANLPHRHARRPVPSRTGGMCVVMCAGGGILSFASFEIASGLGYPNLVQQAPELSAAMITVCLAAPMAAYMTIRGHGRRHDREAPGPARRRLPFATSTRAFRAAKQRKETVPRRLRESSQNEPQERRSRWWGGWGSNPGPADYEKHARPQHAPGLQRCHALVLQEHT